MIKLPFTPAEMQADFEKVLNEFGTSVVFMKHTISYSGLYNEANYLTGSNVSTSGLALFQSIGPSDVQLLPQGQTTLYPQKMFVHGSIDLTANSSISAIYAIGSMSSPENAGSQAHDNASLGSAVGWAQQFTANYTGSLYAIDFIIGRGLNWNNVSASGVVVVTQNNLSGTVIASGVFDGTKVNAYGAGSEDSNAAFYSFTGLNTTVVLTRGSTYFFQLYSQYSAGSGNNHFTVVFDGGTPVGYTGGSAFYGHSGTGWVSGDINAPLMFRVWTAGSLLEYGVIPSMGVTNWDISGVTIYRKAFVRALVGSEFEYVGQ